MHCVKLGLRRPNRICSLGVKDPLRKSPDSPVALITSETHYYLYNAALASRADCQRPYDIHQSLCCVLFVVVCCVCHVERTALPPAVILNNASNLQESLRQDRHDLPPLPDPSSQQRMVKTCGQFLSEPNQQHSSAQSQHDSQRQQQHSAAKKPFRHPPPLSFWGGGGCCWYCIGGGPCW